jgi:hypothetical protein
MVNIQTVIKDNDLLLLTFNIRTKKKNMYENNIQNIVWSNTTHSLII